MIIRHKLNSASTQSWVQLGGYTVLFVEEWKKYVDTHQIMWCENILVIEQWKKYNIFFHQKKREQKQTLYNSFQFDFKFNSCRCLMYCLYFSGKGGPDKQPYEITIEFHEDVNPQVSVIQDLF